MHNVCALSLKGYSVCSFCGSAVIRERFVHQNVDINADIYVYMGTMACRAIMTPWMHRKMASIVYTHANSICYGALCYCWLWSIKIVHLEKVVFHSMAVAVKKDRT